MNCRGFGQCSGILFLRLPRLSLCLSFWPFTRLLYLPQQYKGCLFFVDLSGCGGGGCHIVHRRPGNHRRNEWPHEFLYHFSICSGRSCNEADPVFYDSLFPLCFCHVRFVSDEKPFWTAVAGGARRRKQGPFFGYHSTNFKVFIYCVSARWRGLPGCCLCFRTG